MDPSPLPGVILDLELVRVQLLKMNGQHFALPASLPKELTKGFHTYWQMESFLHKYI
jgi:hypothetical protein